MPDPAVDSVTRDDVIRAGWSDPGRLLRTGLVTFVLLLLALVVLAAIGILAKAGLLEWIAQAGPVLGWFGLGGAVGAGGVAAMRPQS